MKLTITKPAFKLNEIIKKVTNINIANKTGQIQMLITLAAGTHTEKTKNYIKLKQKEKK
jgi:hypothetical protein